MHRSTQFPHFFSCHFSPLSQNIRPFVQVAHANTLRGLVKTIDHIGDEEIQDVAIPTGIPIVYNFKKLANGQLKSVTPKSQEHSVSQLHMKGQFLEKPGLLKVRKRENLVWCCLVLFAGRVFSIQGKTYISVSNVFALDSVFRKH